MTLILIAILNIKEGKLEEAKEALRKAAPKIKELEPGTLEYIPHTFKYNPNSVIFFEKYEDESALQAHSANFPKTMVEFSPLLDRGMVTLTIVNGELTSVRGIEKIE
ncbi:MAG: putative quinol monooxygenase [Candidatus Hodarchaeales archaeon]|jgi:quinol monooxygenase YgiN